MHHFECLYGCGAATSSSAKIGEHMKTCTYSPYTTEVVESSELEVRLMELHQKNRQIVCILPWGYSGGDFDNLWLINVKIIHRSARGAQGL